MKQLKLEVKPRSETGRGPAKRLRAKGMVPGVIYGDSGSYAISVQEPTLRKLMRASSGTAALIQVEGLDGKAMLAVIQELRRDPCKDTFVHIDLHEVAANKPMHATVPVHIEGESIGVKNEGGILEHPHTHVSIKCLPKDLPEYIAVDVSDLAIGDAIHVTDLPKLQGVTYEDSVDTIIAACSAPRLVEEEPEEAAAPVENAEASKEENKA